MARICQRCNHQNEDHAKFCLSCGAMLELPTGPADDPWIGRVLLGRYRPISVLGEGGMGKVYLAEQKMGAATREVAIKTLHPELSKDPQLVARFQRESETVIRLRHPNTIQFFDFGELEDKTLIIVMEYIKGRALSSVLEEEGSISAERAEKILVQVCGSLHEAHQLGVVHRDLKPENVLLTNQGGQTDFVKVLDFGIAKRDDAEDPTRTKLTKQGMVLGTPPYMSPEQFSGEKLDPRSDVYSLGVMAYEMLAGRLPFDANTPWEWATKHLTAHPIPFEDHEHGERLPPHKRAAVMQALAKSRDERPASAQAFLQAFTGHENTDRAWMLATSNVGANVSKAPPQPASPSSAAGGAARAALSPTYPAADLSSMSSPSAPGVSFNTGAMATPENAWLRVLLGAIVLGLFVVLGGAAGVSWYLLAGRASGDASAAPAATAVSEASSGDRAGGDESAAGAGAAEPGAGDGAPRTQPASTVPSQPGGDDSPPEEARATESGPTKATAARAAKRRPRQKARTVPSAPRARPRKRGPSPADVARANATIAAGLGAVRRNDYLGAIEALRQAQRSLGRRHPNLGQLRGELARRGSNQIGIFLQQGHCSSAQRLFGQLRSAGAAGSARRQFGDWCPVR